MISTLLDHLELMRPICFRKKRRPNLSWRKTIREKFRLITRTSMRNILKKEKHQENRECSNINKLSVVISSRNLMFSVFYILLKGGDG